MFHIPGILFQTVAACRQIVTATLSPTGEGACSTVLCMSSIFLQSCLPSQTVCRPSPARESLSFPSDLY